MHPEVRLAQLLMAGGLGPQPGRTVRSGFSLVEMMLVLVIAATVYFMALPGYRQAQLKSHRAIAGGVMLEVMSRQAQYRVNNSRYSPDLTGLGLPAQYYIEPQGQSADPAQAIYKIELMSPDGTFAAVHAIPQNRQRRDRQCMTLTISRDGNRAATGSFAPHPARCW